MGCMKLQNKKVIVITNSSSYEPRAEWVGELFKSQGAQVLWVETDFIHREKVKKVRNAPDHIYIDTVPYRKNLSVRRLYSQYDFARKTEKLLKEEQADLVYIILPANSLAKAGENLIRNMKKAQRKQADGANTAPVLVFDILDLWPEALGIGKLQKLWPFQCWKRLRDDHLGAADLVITECSYFQQFLKTEKEKMATVYWPKEIPENWEKNRREFEGDFAEFQGEFSENQKNDGQIADIDGKLHFAYLGSINNIIDIEEIVNFLEHVQARKEVFLHVIGDGENRTVFEEALKSKGIDAKFYGAVYDETVKEEIFSRCMFGINMMKPGICVGLTMKSIDYFCYGLPLINNIPGDTWELVEKEQIGVNYQRNAVNGSVDKLFTLLEDGKIPEIRRRMQELYIERFTPEAAETVIRERVFPLL